MNIIELAQLSEDQAREYLERLCWPDGPVCPHCDHTETIYRLEGESTRPGLLKCGSCRQPFSVTVGTVMESSKIPLVKWLLAFHLMASSKKGMSAHQLHRTLKVSYKTAWFMAHRIRLAMAEPEPEPLSGVVEADETYVGGKPRHAAWRALGHKVPPSKKTPVFALIERDGRAIATAPERAKAKDIRDIMTTMVSPKAHLMTDESSLYTEAGRMFSAHDSVKHSQREYVRGEAGINTAESFFALVKRQHYGTNHHYSKKHLPAYIAETQFRWNGRKLTDEERREEAIKGIEGKRLTYREPMGNGIKK